ncbi:hypothetical protein HN51_018501, partial [Arachis hypogaea]
IRQGGHCAPLAARRFCFSSSLGRRSSLLPIIRTGINSPARSLGAAIIFNRDHAWNDQWIFWVGPFIGAALATVYLCVVYVTFDYSLVFMWSIMWD